MKMIIKLSTVILIFIICSSCNRSGLKNQSLQTSKPKVSIVFPVTIDAFEQLKKGFQNTTGDRFEIQFYSAEGDPSKFETAIQCALLRKPNYLITIGTQITNIAFGPKFKNKLPTVIAGAISSPELVDALVEVGLNPPRKAEVAIVSDNPQESIYLLFNKAVKIFLPNAKKVGILYNPSEINSKVTSSKIVEILKQRKIEVLEGVINNSEDIEKVTDRLLLNGVETIIIPHDKNAVTKASSIVKKCDEKHIPVFSLDDGTVMKDGVCVGVSVNYNTIGMLIGQTILEIESKKNLASDIPIVAIQSAKIYVNVKKVNELRLQQPSKFNSVIVNINE